MALGREEAAVIARHGILDVLLFVGTVNQITQFKNYS